MGKDELFYKKREARQKRISSIIDKKPNRWLIVCEGEKTEPNYFSQAIKRINKLLPEKNKIIADIKGLGMNTVSLVKTAEDLQSLVDECKKVIIPYGKIFVVFDKDNFSNTEFNKAISMCKKNGFIACWSNQAIEYWFLSHFNYVDSKINRSDYEEKINNEFKKRQFRIDIKRIQRIYLIIY